MDCYLVRIEASGIQRFVFETNKRRENVGASALVASVGEWVEGAVPGWNENWKVPGDDVELMTSAAGSATVLVTSESLAKGLIAQVTHKALTQAPGLDVCGVFERFTWDETSAQGLEEVRAADRAVRNLIPRARSLRPGPGMRFLRVPIVDQCASSGLPARELHNEGLDGEEATVSPRSHASIGKLAAVNAGYERLAEATVGQQQWAVSSKARTAARSGIEAVADYLERDAGWVAVIHADGNGLGDALASFIADTTGTGSRAFVDALHGFSVGIETASGDAYRAALRELRGDGRIPLVKRPGVGSGSFLPVLPLVLGGDDLTVVCDGRAALGFATAYLRAFTAETARSLRASTPGGLTAAAGIAIVKPHYPFSSAYDLAEELTEEAKQVKEGAPGASALSFHVLHDSAAIRLAEIRARQALPDGTRLVAQPYVVSGPATGWARHRRWADLTGRVAALRTPADESGATAEPAPKRPPGSGQPAGFRGGPRLLPRSQTHELRDALFVTTAFADGRYQHLLTRYQNRGLDQLGVGGSLFWPEEPKPSGDGEGDGDGGVRLSGLLDAMDADAFLSDALGAEPARGPGSTDRPDRDPTAASLAGGPQ